MAAVLECASKPVDESSRAARTLALDAIRGLAIGSMVVDHLALVGGGPYWLRLTVGRVAMPLFFLLSGHLVRRFKPRHLETVAIGLVLPLIVPWIDSPNVLVWYGVGAAVVVLCRRFGVLWLPVLLGLAWSANFGRPSPLHVVWGQDAYDGLFLVGLMCLGALLPRSAFAWGGRLPFGRPLAALGRYPLAFYVGHLLILQGLVMIFVKGG